MDEKEILRMIDLQRKHCESQRIGDCVDKDCNDCSARVFYNAGYRKESDTAREILKWLVGKRHLFNRTHEIGFEKPRTSYLIESDEIEELAEKYGVDLGE
jgi:hypothetical protein